MKDEYRLEAGFYDKIWGRHDYDIDADSWKIYFKSMIAEASSTLDAAQETMFCDCGEWDMKSREWTSVQQC